MEAEIAQQNKIQASIHQETKFLKKSATELKDQIASLSNALQEFQAEERNLSKEKVQSPDRIKLDLANAMQTLEQVKKDIVRKQQERAMVRKQLEHISAADEKLKLIMTDMNELEVKMQTYKVIVRKLEIDLEEKKKVKESQVCQFQLQTCQLEPLGMSHLLQRRPAFFVCFTRYHIRRPHKSSSWNYYYYERVH